MVLARIIVNVLSYLFHVYIARALDPSAYGILGSLLGFFYIFSIPASSTAIAIAKRVSALHAREQHETIAGWLSLVISRSAKWGSIMLLLMGSLSPLIANLLEIPSPVLPLLTILFLFTSLLSSVSCGFLQGLSKFDQVGLSLSTEALSRFLVGTLLLSLGLGVAGALSAYIMAAIAGFLVSLLPLRFLLEGKRREVSFPLMDKHFPAILVSLSCFAVMTNVDMLVVKRFLGPDDAGFYAATVTLGKALLLFSSLPGYIMFPRISFLSTIARKTLPDLKQTLLYVGLMASGVVLIYWLLSDYLINALYGPQYRVSASLLGPFSLAMGLAALTMTYVKYCLALDKVRVVKILALFTCLEIALLGCFHKDLSQVVRVLIFTNLIVPFAFFVESRLATTHRATSIRAVFRTSQAGFDH